MLEALPGRRSHALLRVDQLMAMQNPGHRTRRQQGHAEIEQAPAQLTPAPGRMLCAQLNDRILQFAHGQAGMAQRSSRALHQTLSASLLVARQPFIAGLWADPEALAQGPTIRAFLPRQQNKFLSKIHDVFRVPGHGQSLRQVTADTVNHVRAHLSAMSPVHTFGQEKVAKKKATPRSAPGCARSLALLDGPGGWLNSPLRGSDNASRLPPGRLRCSAPLRGTPKTSGSRKLAVEKSAVLPAAFGFPGPLEGAEQRRRWRIKGEHCLRGKAPSCAAPAKAE